MGARRRRAHRPWGQQRASYGGVRRTTATAFRRRPRRPSTVSGRGEGPYGGDMSRLRTVVGEPVSLASSLALREPTPAGPTRTGRDRAVDARRVRRRRRPRSALPEPGAARQRHADVDRSSSWSTCAAAASPACRSWWPTASGRWASRSCASCWARSRSRRPPAALLALFSLAARRPIRSVLLVLVLWIPAALVFAAYSPTTDARLGGPGHHSPGPRRHGVGNVRAGPAAAAALPPGACRAGGGRPAAARGPGADGWNAPGSRARCTTCSLTASP